MLNCMIIDDDIMARKSLEHLCQKADGLNIVSMFDNAQQGLDFLLKDSVDLIFLDIEMPDITGLEFIEQARALPQVIFTTSNTDYAYDAFEYQVTDFLKKPITLPRFTLAVDKAKEIQKQNNEYKANAREVYIKESGRYTGWPMMKYSILKIWAIISRFRPGSRAMLYMEPLKRLKQN